MALLVHAQSADFRFVRDHLGLSDSDLSKQMAELAGAGYIEIHKRGRGPGATTTYKITRAGRKAYDGYLAALSALLSGPALPADA